MQNVDWLGSNFHKVWHDIPTNAGNKLTWKSVAIANLENKYFETFLGLKGHLRYSSRKVLKSLEPGDNIQFRMMSESIHWLNDKIPVEKISTLLQDMRVDMLGDWAPFENRGVRLVI